MAFRIGISAWADTRAGIERVGRFAVEAGISTFWLGDGLLRRPEFPPWAGGMEPFTELAWLAGRIPEASVGITAAVLPLRDPVWVAKQAASIDQLTEGRFTLIVTPGNWPDEFEAAGKQFSARGRDLEDGVRVIQDVFADEANDRGPSPKPYTKGGPPVWLAGGTATWKRALRLRLPFQARLFSPTELAPLAKWWFESGGTELGHRVRLGVADTVDVSERGIFGPPGFLAEQVVAFRDLGVSDLSVMPGQDIESTLATVSALAEHALPALAE